MSFLGWLVHRARAGSARVRVLPPASRGFSAHATGAAGGGADAKREPQSVLRASARLIARASSLGTRRVRHALSPRCSGETRGSGHARARRLVGYHGRAVLRAQDQVGTGGA